MPRVSCSKNSRRVRSGHAQSSLRTSITSHRKYPPLGPVFVRQRSIEMLPTNAPAPDLKEERGKGAVKRKHTRATAHATFALQIFLAELPQKAPSDTQLPMRRMAEPARAVCTSHAACRQRNDVNKAEGHFTQSQRSPPRPNPKERACKYTRKPAKYIQCSSGSRVISAISYYGTTPRSFGARWTNSRRSRVSKHATAVKSCKQQQSATSKEGADCIEHLSSTEGSRATDRTSFCLFLEEKRRSQPPNQRMLQATPHRA